MIKRATTEDIESLKNIWSHPEIAPYIRDDLTPKMEIDFKPLVSNPLLYFLMAITESGDKAGCFFVHPWNSICFEVHTLILPEFRGKVAITLGKEAIEWGFTETLCTKIVTQVPTWNRKAYAFALRVGFKIEGNNKSSFLWKGKLYDQYFMGKIKEN